jgi:cytoskeletal protein CcmA (bactofilin family)
MLKSKENASMDRMGDLNTLIGKGSVFEGNLNVQHSLRIDGKLIGNIKSSDSIIVGKEGEVDGEVDVKNAVIGGKIKGKVIASGKITLESTSTFNGQLIAGKLVIDEGAVFDGTSQMGDSTSKSTFQPKEFSTKVEGDKGK